MKENSDTRNQERVHQEFGPSWGYFIFFTCLAVACFYYEIYGYLGTILFGCAALLCFPNRGINDQILKLVKNSWNILGKMLKLSIKISAILLFVWFIYKFLSGVGSFGNYEGLSAEEWYYEYDEAESNYQDLYSCVENYAYSDSYSDLKDIAAYCL